MNGHDALYLPGVAMMRVPQRPLQPGEIVWPPSTRAKRSSGGETSDEYVARGGRVYHAAIGESGIKDQGPVKFHVSEKNKQDYIPGRDKPGRKGWK